MSPKLCFTLLLVTAAAITSCGGGSSGGGGAGASVSSVASSSASSASSSSSSSTSSAGPQYPADVLTLQSWKLQLPTGPSNASTEISQPTLATYSNSPWFTLNGDKSAVLFRANAGGSRTSTNTAYSRSELREMSAGGNTVAAWDCMGATRKLHIEQVLTHTPVIKAQASIGQIHDQTNDNLMLFYRGPSTANGTTDTGSIEVYFNDHAINMVLDTAYHLGDRMAVDVSVATGMVTVHYQNLTTGKTTDVGPVSLTGTIGQCYFKAGVYVQSCSTTDSNGNTNTECVAKNFPRYDTADAYAELAVSRVTLN